jgi:flagellar motor protein MotB
MGIRLSSPEEHTPWLSVTDLLAGMFTIFILAFILIAVLKQDQEKAFTRKEQEYQELKNAKDQQEDALRRLQDRNRKLESVLSRPIEQGVIAITDGKIDIQEAILFPSAHAQVRGDAVGILRQVAEALALDLDTNEMLMVAGFTDDIPIRSRNFSSNWELSTARATNIVKVMIESGFPSNRIFASGFGEYQPKVPNSNAKNRSINRRVEIVRVPFIRNQFESRQAQGNPS